MKNETFFGIYKYYFDGFLIYKRSLGYNYGRSMVYDMIDLNKYLDRCNPDQIIITEEIANEYIREKEYLSSGSIHRHESILRQFSIYLKNMGSKDIFIYTENHIKVSTDFTPYIFKKKEMELIFKAIDEIQEPHKDSHDYKMFYQVIIRLLYGCGLRVSEALNLKLEDVDLINNLLMINNSKDNVSRLVPFNENLSYWMKKYHDKHIDNINYFFEFRIGQKRSKSCVSQRFKNNILVLAGIPKKADGTGPRLHDLRHTFACHSLDKMIKSGKDPYCALPYLSTYLGHKGIESTEKYLRLTDTHFKEITDAGKYIYGNSIGKKDE